MALNWEQTFRVLREKSTMAGLVGLGVAIAATFGVDVEPNQELILTEVVLAIISVVAIATRPRDAPRHGHPETWHDRKGDNIVRDDRSSHSAVSGPVGNGRVREQHEEEEPGTETADRPDRKGDWT